MVFTADFMQRGLDALVSDDAEALKAWARDFFTAAASGVSPAGGSDTAAPSDAPTAVAKQALALLAARNLSTPIARPKATKNTYGLSPSELSECKRAGADPAVYAANKAAQRARRKRAPK